MPQSPSADNAQQYDLVVLGAGPVGENVVERARAYGLSVAVVESELAGGECSYWACMPSKALLRPPTALHDARRVPGAAEATAGSTATDPTLRHRDAFTSHWDDEGQVSWLESLGAIVVRGHGRLDGPRRVMVETDQADEYPLSARLAVAVCTGSRAVLPNLPGIEDARPWTNREGTGARTVPGRLAVIGGGPVGVELASAWNALGSRVTMLVRGSGLLSGMEPFAGQLVADGLDVAGITVRTGTTAVELRRPDPTGPTTVLLDDGDSLDVDEVLFATGRAPRTADIGLESVDLSPGAWMEVDETCRVTGVEDNWLYAVGDVNQRALVTHQGKYQARIAGSAIGLRARGETVDTTPPWGMHTATADRAASPQVIFTDPEVASVGRTAAQAERDGYRVRVVDYDIGSVAGAALYADGYRGHARMVVDLDREVLVGATFAGPAVSELLHSATIAVAGEVPLDRLWHAVPAFPTISEVWLRLLETYRG